MAWGHNPRVRTLGNRPQKCSSGLMPRPQVLITGAAARIGAQIARSFADEGWHVVIHHRNSHQAAEQLARTLPSAETVDCDFCDNDACAAMITALARRLDDWRVLVNCAAIFPHDSAAMPDIEKAREAMQINAFAPALMTRLFLAHAQSKGGRCAIALTDQKLENPNPDFFSYTMSKHALAAAIKMLAMEACGPEDRVYGLAPGAILASHDQSEEETEISHRLNLLERKTGAIEVAKACLFLAQRHLRNGETLFIDSGQHLLSQPRDVIFLGREMADQ